MNQSKVWYSNINVGGVNFKAVNADSKKELNSVNIEVTVCLSVWIWSFFSVQSALYTYKRLCGSQPAKNED